MARERPTPRSSLRRPWEPEEDAVLLEMLHQGRSTGGIGVRLKRSARAIAKRKTTLQEPKRSTESP